MTFKINATTSISNTPSVAFSLLINKPAVMAVLAGNKANGTILTTTSSLSSTLLTLA